MKSAVLTILLLPAATGILAAQDSTAKKPAAQLGVYTVEQSDRGQLVYKGECARCHDVQDHTNNEFRFKWDGRTVRGLFDYLRTTMPDDGPGELTPQQYLDVTAYILKINGLPAGESPLVSDSTALGKFVLDLKAKPTLLRR